MFISSEPSAARDYDTIIDVDCPGNDLEISNGMASFSACTSFLEVNACPVGMFVLPQRNCHCKSMCENFSEQTGSIVFYKKGKYFKIMSDICTIIAKTV